MYFNIPDRVHLSFEKSLEADCMYWEMLKRRGQKGGQRPRLEIQYIQFVLLETAWELFFFEKMVSRDVNFCKEKGNLLVMWQMTAKKRSVLINRSFILMQIFHVFSVENTV